MNLRDSFRKRLGKKEFDVNDLTSLLKAGDQVKCVQHLLKVTSQKERVRIISNLFIKSRYKAYKIAMARFEENINKYLNDDKKTFKEYSAAIEKEQSDMPVNISNAFFTNIRKSIIVDAMNNDIGSAFTAITFLYDGYDNLALQDPTDYMPIICDLAANKWPEHTAIKVLFGN